MYVGLHVKYSLFLSDFNETFELCGQIFEKKKNIQISNVMKILLIVCTAYFEDSLNITHKQMP